MAEDSPTKEDRLNDKIERKTDSQTFWMIIGGVLAIIGFIANLCFESTRRI